MRLAVQMVTFLPDLSMGHECFLFSGRASRTRGWGPLYHCGIPCAQFGFTFTIATIYNCHRGLFWKFTLSSLVYKCLAIHGLVCFLSEENIGCGQWLICMRKKQADLVGGPQTNKSEKHRSPLSKRGQVYKRIGTTLVYWHSYFFFSFSLVCEAKGLFGFH